MKTEKVPTTINTKEDLPTPSDRTEKRQTDMDKEFDKLIESVTLETNRSPQARSIVQGEVLGNLRRTMEQIKSTSEIQNLNELKRSMVKQWQELEALTQGDPRLLEAIQKWGDEFVDSRELYYDRINEVKENLTDLANKLEKKWFDVQIRIGKLVAMTNDDGMVATIVRSEVGRLTEGSRTVDDMLNKPFDFTKYNPLERYIESIRTLETGFDAKDINIDQEYPKTIMKRCFEFIRVVTTEVYKKKINWNEDTKTTQKTSPVEDEPSVGVILGELEEDFNKIAEIFQRMSDIFMATKKIKDTNSLRVHNRQPKLK